MPWGTVLPAWCCCGRSSPRLPSLPGRENSPFQDAGGGLGSLGRAGFSALESDPGVLGPPPCCCPNLSEDWGTNPLLGYRCTKRGLGVISGDKPNVLGPRCAQHPPHFAALTLCTGCSCYHCTPPTLAAPPIACRGDKQPPQSGPPPAAPAAIGFEKRGPLGPLPVDSRSTTSTATSAPSRSTPLTNPVVL